ncbi:MAG: UDP-N-acetylmuramoyl-L-alanine--D-glutamate ligase [Paludibacteraceae bacterium]|nr:UDP-N-acetylmuramoyl-L-alanine--D-glutamate ligase [Paludibacteraceae bacterium]
MNQKGLIAILGAGESGVGAAVLAQKEGFDVWVSDNGTIKPNYKKELEKRGIAYEEGSHDEEKILSSVEIIKSPGIPNDSPLITKATQKGISVISEIEFAGRYSNAKMICITGSNGKTTTTLLTYHILKQAGYDVGLAGNVGKSLALQVAEKDRTMYVIELSSFQLDNMYDFKADIAILLNITPDHLDRYDHCYQNYINAKFRITQNQTEKDAFIYWADDPIIKQELAKRGDEIRATRYPFSLEKKDGAQAFVDHLQLVIKTHKDTFQMPVEELSLIGDHNRFNSMAAGLSARLTDVSEERLRKSLADFGGVEHRIEYVATVGGVRYVNDSKATNVNSCWYALQSMTTPVVLILGGKDKGNDYREIEELVKEKVKGMVFLGVDNEKLHNFFDGKVARTEDARSMEECVRKCAAMAEDGDTVLLSPCCASFDLFKSYEDRGNQFKERVKAL